MFCNFRKKYSNILSTFSPRILESYQLSLFAGCVLNPLGSFHALGNGLSNPAANLHVLPNGEDIRSLLSYDNCYYKYYTTSLLLFLSQLYHWLLHLPFWKVQWNPILTCVCSFPLDFIALLCVPVFVCVAMIWSAGLNYSRIEIWHNDHNSNYNCLYMDLELALSKWRYGPSCLNVFWDDRKVFLTGNETSHFTKYWTCPGLRGSTCNAHDKSHHIPGKIGQEVYELCNSAASCNRTSFYTLYERQVCPPSFVVWQPDLLPEAAEWQAKILKGVSGGQPN